MKKILFLTLVAQTFLQEETRVGAYEKRDGIQMCTNALSKISDDFPAFNNYTITHCET